MKNVLRLLTTLTATTLTALLAPGVGASQVFAQQKTVTVSAVGDIMMGTDYPEDKLPADEARNLFMYSASYIQASDIRFGNLEGPLYDGEQATGGKAGGANRYKFRTPTHYADRLREAGFNVLSMANNHAHDFGAEGLASTKAALASRGLQYSSKNGGEVAKFNIRGVKVALIAVDYYPGNRSLRTPEKTYREIRELKKSHPIVIVSAHAGGEGTGAARTVNENEIYLGENRGNSVQFAHEAIDAGASLIIMHGPHVPRALEIYKNNLIAYSLGNFATSRGINVLGDNGLAPLLRVQMDAEGRFLQGQVASFRQLRDKGTVYDKSQAALVEMKSLSELDFPSSMPQFEMSTGKIFP